MARVMHGLDRASPPSAADAKAMLDRFDGLWWAVYIGGPRVSHRWKPEEVAGIRAAGVDHFLLIYVGLQQNDVARLSAAQGDAHGEEACDLAARFGSGPGAALCLDLELPTFEAARERSLDYVGGWCQAVRRRRLRPGVYANPGPLMALARRDEREKPDWVWVARWLQEGHLPSANPGDIKDFPDHLWKGNRVWQYEGEHDLTPVNPRFGKIDINVTTDECRALTGLRDDQRLHIPPTEEDMFTFSTAGKPVFFVAGGKAVGLNSSNDLQVIKSAVRDLPHFTLDPDTFDSFLRTYRD